MDRAQETRTFTVNGLRGHALEAREENDFYATSPLALRCLLKYFQEKNFQLSKNCLEPACGMGHLSKMLKQHYQNVVSTDLIDRGYGVGGVNFLQSTSFQENGIVLNAGDDFDIISNPPFKISTDFINHALDILAPGKVCAMFMKLAFLEGINRYRDLFKDRPPNLFLVLPSRIGCCKSGQFKDVDKYGDPIAGSAIAFAWYIWIKGISSQTIVDWFDPDKR